MAFVVFGSVVRRKALVETITYNARMTSAMYKVTLGRLSVNYEALTGSYDQRFLKSMLARIELFHGGVGAVLLGLNGLVIISALTIASIVVDPIITAYGLFICITVFGLLVLLHRRGVVDASTKLNSAVTKRFQIATDLTDNTVEISLANKQKYYEDILHKNEMEFRTLQGNNSIRGKSPRIYIEALLLIIVCMLLMITDKTFEMDNIGNVIALSLIVFKIIPPAQQIYSGVLNLQLIDKALQDLNKIIQPPINCKLKLEQPSVLERVSIKGVVVDRRGVQICYPNFEFYKNCLNIVTGRSGSGKSTLLKILLGFCDHDSGDVVYNTQNASLACDEIKKSFSSASSPLLYGSLKENICFFGDRYDVLDFPFLQDLWDLDASKMLHTASLSSGQMQRISIARAFNSDAQLIVLDEPTANLDAENAKLVLEFLEKKSHDSIIIIATHDDLIKNTKKSRLLAL